MVTGLSVWNHEAGKEGSVIHAKFFLGGQEFMCIDSSIEHSFTFNAVISLYVICYIEDVINQLFEKLSEDGSVLTSLEAYPFSERFGWVQDKFGISWQLSFKKINNRL